MQLATALRSIVEANPMSWPIEVYVLSHGFSGDMRKKVIDSLPGASVKIHWKSIDYSIFRGFSAYLDISKIIYARLLIPFLIPGDVSRVLYLDADVLVLDTLASLCETNLEGSVVGAVLDYLDSKPTGGDVATTLGLPCVQHYFNSGVLLIDLDRWKAEKISEKALEYLQNHRHLRFPDQDALNIACNGCWMSLDAKYNFQDHLDTQVQNIPRNRRPTIVHFVTSRKPWNISALNLNAKLYNSFRDRTCFAQDFWAKLSAPIQYKWMYSKRFLRKYSFLRSIWSRLRRGSSHADVTV